MKKIIFTLLALTASSVQTMEMPGKPARAEIPAAIKESALMEAIAKNDTKRATELVQEAPFTATPHFYQMALGTAILSGRTHIAELLLMHGANLHSPVDPHGTMPLYYAAYFYHIKKINRDISPKFTHDSEAIIRLFLNYKIRGNITEHNKALLDNLKESKNSYISLLPHNIHMMLCAFMQDDFAISNQEAEQEAQRDVYAAEIIRSELIRRPKISNSFLSFFKHCIIL